MGFVNFEVKRREIKDSSWEDTLLSQKLYMDGVLPSGIPGRHILELDECNMYSYAKYANKTTAAVFISSWVLCDLKTGFKAEEATRKRFC